MDLGWLDPWFSSFLEVNQKNFYFLERHGSSVMVYLSIFGTPPTEIKSSKNGEHSYQWNNMTLMGTF